MNRSYHETRLAHDVRRGKVWKALWRHYFCDRIGAQDCVLDLGCGYGEFINNVTAGRRLAVDLWPDMPLHLAPGIEAHVGSVSQLDWIDDSSVDFAFASNLFEHVPQAEFATTLRALARKLSPKGTLTILQPNYRYAYREYFDDYTHVSVYSHISLCDFLTANGYEPVEVRPRFLPLTIKSRLPVSSMLIGAYLRSPVKPLAKQMLVVAKPSRDPAQ